MAWRVLSTTFRSLGTDDPSVGLLGGSTFRLLIGVFPAGDPADLGRTRVLRQDGAHRSALV